MIGILVNGREYVFDNPTHGYLTAAEGFGMPPLRRFASQGAQQHGESDLGYRLNTRRATLVIELPASNEAEFYQARERLLSLFHPANSIALKVTDGAGLDRRLDCVFETGMSLTMDSGWRVQKVGIILRTEGLPAWYDPAARSAVFELGGGSGACTIPMSVPHAVGATDIEANAVLRYAGTWEEYPRIKITGPLTNCKVVNNATGETLDFTGYSLPSGHFIEMDLRYGFKTVLLDGVTNCLDKLTAGSDIATFHLAPRLPGETVRENSFTVSGTGANSMSKVEVFYNDRYLGL